MRLVKVDLESDPRPPCLDFFPTLTIFYFCSSVRDRKEMPQVLFVFSSRKGGGEGVEARENTKPEKKHEENGGRGGC